MCKKRPKVSCWIDRVVRSGTKRKPDPLFFDFRRGREESQLLVFFGSVDLATCDPPYRFVMPGLKREVSGGADVEGLARAPSMLICRSDK
jgi:hypothetical protein